MRSVLENVYIYMVKTGKESELYMSLVRAIHTPSILCETLCLGELYVYLIGTKFIVSRLIPILIQKLC